MHAQWRKLSTPCKATPWVYIIMWPLRRSQQLCVFHWKETLRDRTMWIWSSCKYAHRLALQDPDRSMLQETQLHWSIPSWRRQFIVAAGVRFIYSYWVYRNLSTTCMIHRTYGWILYICKLTPKWHTGSTARFALRFNQWSQLLHLELQPQHPVCRHRKFRQSKARSCTRCRSTENGSLEGAWIMHRESLQRISPCSSNTKEQLQNHCTWQWKLQNTSRYVFSKVSEDMGCSNRIPIQPSL